eukprot:gnl/MRDRNA2_/MRDRNA2_35163_c0_seq1.p1 gnl/MRDRNA2_/MRDRNA2_35163_c0~~gnl/MRDRNA2_/MRDRNA2_35163_c0_seq1.p1  ORF type:complete len:112 (+),score=7.76 gnl/MRDRNA2_/MRDRNA2_35163_c0_seq1:384-719(+)
MKENAIMLMTAVSLDVLSCSQYAIQQHRMGHQIPSSPQAFSQAFRNFLESSNTLQRQFQQLQIVRQLCTFVLNRTVQAVCTIILTQKPRDPSSDGSFENLTVRLVKLHRVT